MLHPLIIPRSFLPLENFLCDLQVSIGKSMMKFRPITLYRQSMIKSIT